MCGTLPCCQNCCGKHANCEVYSCVLVIDIFESLCCDDVVACMGMLEAVVIGLDHWIDFIASMLTELDQLIDCVDYA